MTGHKTSLILLLYLKQKNICLYMKTAVFACKNNKFHFKKTKVYKNRNIKNNAGKF